MVYVVQLFAPLSFRSTQNIKLSVVAGTGQTYIANTAAGVAGPFKGDHSSFIQKH
jgi:hypothetical protein